MKLIDRIVAHYWFRINMVNGFNIYSYAPPRDRYYAVHMFHIQKLSLEDDNFYEDYRG
jgi:hypothetical protein